MGGSFRARRHKAPIRQGLHLQRLVELWDDDIGLTFLMKSGDKMDNMIEFFLVLIERAFRDNGESD